MSDGRSRPSVLVFTTGGTIASLPDADAGGLVTAIGGKAVVDAAGGVDDVCSIELVELAGVSSTVLSAERVFEWAQEVERRLAAGPAAGAVVVMGTEAMEEAAYLFDLVVRSPKPVVFTGAMRAAGDPLADGPHNLVCACRVAVTPAVVGLGVLVALGEEVHAAREVVKTHTSSPGAFRSPRSGPVAVVAPGGTRGDVVLVGRPFRREHVPATRIEPRVAYAKTVLGMDGGTIDQAVASGARGLVIEGFPGGGITPAMADAVERARSAGVTVVVAARAARGELSDTYAGVGEGRWLRERGVLFAHGLAGPKARIKLMLALGLDEPSEVDALFAVGAPSPAPRGDA